MIPSLIDRSVTPNTPNGRLPQTAHRQLSYLRGAHNPEWVSIFVEANMMTSGARRFQWLANTWFSRTSRFR